MIHISRCIIRLVHLYINDIFDRYIRIDYNVFHSFLTCIIICIDMVNGNGNGNSKSKSILYLPFVLL